MDECDIVTEKIIIIRYYKAVIDKAIIRIK